MLSRPALLIALFLFSGYHTLLAGSVAGSPSDSTAPVLQLVPNSLIYRGTEYAKVYTPSSGSPFFRDYAYKGRVDYFTNRYDSVSLFYDIEDDLLVSYDVTHQVRIGLVSDKVADFMIDGHRFISLRDTSGFKGFFEEKYVGKRRVLVKWQKILTRQGSEEGRYIGYTLVFVQEGNTLTQVSSRQDIYSLFPQNRKSMQQFYHDQHLDYKKDPLEAAAQLVAFADRSGW